MMQAFRENLDPAAVRVKSLEARLALETERCLKLEKQVKELETRLAREAARPAHAQSPEEERRTLRLMPHLPAKISKPAKKKV